jgi:hypothetical protein
MKCICKKVIRKNGIPNIIRPFSIITIRRKKSIHLGQKSGCTVALCSIKRLIDIILVVGSNAYNAHASASPYTMIMNKIEPGLQVLCKKVYFRFKGSVLDCFPFPGSEIIINEIISKT